MDSTITKMNLSSFYEGTPSANADISWTNNGELPLTDVDLNLLIGHYDPVANSFSIIIHVTQVVTLAQYSSIVSRISNIDISMLPKGTYDVYAYIEREGVIISPGYIEEEALEILGPEYSAAITSVSFSS